MRKKSIEELTEELGEILKDIYETEGLEKARHIVTDTMQKVEQNIIGDLQNKSEWDLILSQIEEMARNLTGPRKIADQLNCTVNVVYTTIRKKEIYNRRDVRKLMAEGKSDEEIAKEGNLNPEAVITYREELKRASEELNRKKQEKAKENSSRKSEISTRIVEMARNLIEPIKIASILQCDVKKVYSATARYHIYGRTKVKELIEDGKNSEQIAKVGNLNIEAVIRFRDELSNNNVNTKTAKIIEMAKELISPDIISKKLQTSLDYIYSIISENDIYSRRKVKKAIEAGKTDEEIAKEGNVNLDAVTRYRAKPDIADNMHYNSRAYSNPREQNEKILKMARNLTGVDSIVSSLSVPEYTVRNLLRKNNIYAREEVIALIQENEKGDKEIAEDSGCNVILIKALRKSIENLHWAIENDEIKKKALTILQNGRTLEQAMKATNLKMPEVKAIQEVFVASKKQPVDRQKLQFEFKTEMINLRRTLNESAQSSKTQAQIIDYRVQKILYKYIELLQESDYALLAYAYAKTGEYMKAIEFGEEYLDLDTPSLSALQARIDEILKQEKVKKAEQSTPTRKIASELTRTANAVKEPNGKEHSDR